MLPHKNRVISPYVEEVTRTKGTTPPPTAVTGAEHRGYHQKGKYYENVNFHERGGGLQNPITNLSKVQLVCMKAMGIFVSSCRMLCRTVPASWVRVPY